MDRGTGTTAWSKALIDPDRRPSSLEPIDVNVGLVLQVFADWEHGDECFPSIDTLAEASGRARTTVMPALDRLEAAGCIRRDRGSKRKPTHYVLLKFWSEQSRSTTAERSPSTTTERPVDILQTSASSSATETSGSDRHASSSHALAEWSQETPLPIHDASHEPQQQPTSSGVGAADAALAGGEAPAGSWKWWSPLVGYALALDSGDRWGPWDSIDIEGLAQALHLEHKRGLTVAQIISNVPVPGQGQTVRTAPGFVRAQLKGITPRGQVELPTGEFGEQQIRALVVNWHYRRFSGDTLQPHALLDDVDDPVAQLRRLGFDLDDRNTDRVNATWRMMTAPPGGDGLDEHFANAFAWGFSNSNCDLAWISGDTPAARGTALHQAIEDAQRAMEEAA